jgi:glycosyltransferase involved in cell wall biosynthesis
MMRRWTVAQIGAREHYAIAAAFARNGNLRELYTEAWWPFRSGMSSGPMALRSFTARHNHALSYKQVRSFTAAWIIRSITKRAGGARNLHDEFIRDGSWFARRVRDRLSSRRLDPSQDAFFGYDTGSLEALEFLREVGVPTVVDQIDPARVEESIVQEERQRWPGWEIDAPAVPESYWERLGREWALSDFVLVNSDWSRMALEQQGVPREKLLVVPLAYEGSAPNATRSPRPPGAPLRVLWLGSVTLRKGIQYLLAAAERLLSQNIRFVIAGPIHISRQIVSSAPANVQFVGRVPRGGLLDMYSSADVFALPTISDGFAITQLEAMAHGVPVMVTRNCGTVVTHGRDGLIVGARDVDAIVQALDSLERDRDMLRELSREAIRTSARFSLERVAEALGSAVSRLETRCSHSAGLRNSSRV